jgi:hypothetical protein
MDLLGTWGKRTQDLLGGVRRSLLGEDLPPDEKRAATVGTFGPSLASQMQGLDTAQRTALAGGGVPALMSDPAVAEQATDLAGQLDLLGPIKAYHGTPHTFLPEPEHPMGRFRMDKLGTGEGAQAYGHGLYFAEEPAVAEGYRDALAGRGIVSGKQWQRPGTLAAKDIPDADEAVNVLSGFWGSWQPTQIPQEIRKRVQSAQADVTRGRNMERPPPWLPEAEKELAKVSSAQRALDKHGIEAFQPNRGSLYEVELGLEHEDLLDWDLPLSKQPPKVREAIQPLLDSMTEERLKTRRALAAKFQAAGAPNPLENVEDVWDKSTGQQLVNLLRDKIGSPDAASRALREAGIPGIRYLDAGSRGTSEGSRNVVLFDDALARIQGRR